MHSSAVMRYIPNALSVARIVLTPVVLLLLTVSTLQAQVTAVVLFVAASASDYYDGKLARQMGVRSRLGQFLDPLADKILVLGVFGMLSVLEPQAVPLWAVLVIAVRDVLVTAMRSWAESKGRTLRTFRVAKAKTMSQLAFLFGMLVLRATTHLPGSLSGGATWLLRESVIPYVCLWIVVGLTVGTGALYVLQPEEDTIA